MTVDPYAVCPCGNGKKIKFCKCKDSVGLLDSVITMVEGGQVVPALDKLSSILTENPDAAWAYAIRGRLLLDLREYDTLGENAERFIRLQPSNPLALTQRAAANLFKGDAEDATSTMLEALTESGRDVDSFVLDVSSVLAYSLAQSGAFLTARVYATLAMMASGYQGGQTAVSVLRQLNQAPTISQLLKSIPDPIPRPEEVSWGERYDEAATLLTNNQVLLAKDKFESLQKTVSGEPAILSGLLTCAIWRGDLDDQVSLLKKLSNCESLPMKERVRFRAMSALAKPGPPELSLPTFELNGEITKAEEVEMAMMANSRFVTLPADMVAGMRASEEDVPPRAGFQILNRDKPEDVETLPPVDEVPEAIGMLFVYGKQTDREARIEALDIREDSVDEVRTQIESVVDGIQLEQKDAEPIPLIIAAQPTIAMVRFKVKPAEAEKLQKDLIANRMPRVLTSLKLPILAGQTLAQSKDNADLLLERSAVVRVIEQYDALASKLGENLSKVYEAAGVPVPEVIKASDTEIESLDNEDLSRVDFSALNAESLIYLIQRAQQVSSSIAMQRAAKRLLEVEMTEEQKPARMLAYMTLINTAENNEEALGLLDKAKAFAAEHTISNANLLLTEIPLRLQMGDGPGFQERQLKHAGLCPLASANP